MAISDARTDRYDPWYVKLAFGLFLSALVGSLIVLYGLCGAIVFIFPWQSSPKTRSVTLRLSHPVRQLGDVRRDPAGLIKRSSRALPQHFSYIVSPR